MKRSSWLAVALALGSACAQAQEQAYPSELPPRAIAERAIREAPQVRAADALVRAEEANRERLSAGPHEWVASAGTQRRNVRSEDRRFVEWDVGLERGLRLPGKAALDRQLGAQGVAQAQAAQGDALHETARALLRGWFGWLRERGIWTQWREQAALLERQRAATARRVELGDAPRLELVLAEAALAQARAAQEHARARMETAAGGFARRFPGVPLPEQVELGTPSALAGDAQSWRELLLEHNHELALAREESRRARLLAARTGAERVPDPSVALHVGSERAGDERIVGVRLALPLSGTARRAQHDASVAQAEAAASREAQTLARLEAEIHATYVAAQSAHDNWRSASAAAARMTEAADLTARSHALGEAPLADLLTARRLANEAVLAAGAAQTDALEARARLLLDAHRLWNTAD